MIDKAGSPDWAAQLQECRGWWRGECDDIFELCLFTHLSTKIKIQQPRGAESRSAWLQRAGRTDLLLLPLGEPRRDNNYSKENLKPVWNCKKL